MIVTRRAAKIIEIGNSIGLTLSQELEHLGLQPQQTVYVMVETVGTARRIIIESDTPVKDG